MLQRLTRGQTLHNYEARLRCKDGALKTVLIDSNVLWQGDRFIHMRCFTRDITERKRVEAALRESEARYRSLVENANDGIVTFTLEGIVTSVNRGWSLEKTRGDSGNNRMGRAWNVADSLLL
jgi:PAS domain-containing protein